MKINLTSSGLYCDRAKADPADNKEVKALGSACNKSSGVCTPFLVGRGRRRLVGELGT